MCGMRPARRAFVACIVVAAATAAAAPSADCEAACMHRFMQAAVLASHLRIMMAEFHAGRERRE